MDTTIASLPPQVGAILMDNIEIVEIVSMFSIGAYNALEIAFVTFDKFKRHRSLYFWSMQVASWGILVHALPAMARLISQASNLATSVPFMIGWYAMVTGQAVVLYSRLNLVVQHQVTQRCVLWMIIVNACALHIPMTVLFFGLNSGDRRFATPAAIFDRIQSTFFSAQDLIICGIYIREAVQSMKLLLATREQEARRVINHLVWITTVIVVLNVLLLITEYRMHYIQVSFKTVVYSIKLKLEFSVLNRLCHLVQPQPFVFQEDLELRGGSGGENLRPILSQPSAPSETEEVCQGSKPTGPAGEWSQHVSRETCEMTGHAGAYLKCGSTPTPHSMEPRTSPNSSSGNLRILELTLPEFSPKIEIWEPSRG
ncbi:uncharacterized protein N7483_002550 [Penicillium malachiteum]|uniref:uncharacterized protein n=1 Tax=Penicillium malachiteum TaxID=1324776 RepID=UPI002547ECC6|nr:uncharacterized protein N7483_002418 [Penicillium malachiteum]XP_056952136.1 uncharacterized protein N7483_002550 [Penicillium malachiteum]KAJ5737293.1 hypothetical protein N7483_002418 [Penicillium malachiteum]KAJ5737425.1 hypothetical protein N7483_002550 [Penicillium malachiteum]